MYTINDLLDLSKTIAAPLFEGKTYPWEVLADISDYIIALGSTLPEEEYEKRGENVWIARDAEVFPSAYIGAPCIIDHGAQVRHCAFIRGSAIVGKTLLSVTPRSLKTLSFSIMCRRRTITMSAIRYSATRRIWAQAR